MPSELKLALTSAQAAIVTEWTADGFRADVRNGEGGFVTVTVEVRGYVYLDGALRPFSHAEAFISILPPMSSLSRALKMVRAWISSFEDEQLTQDAQKAFRDVIAQIQGPAADVRARPETRQCH